MSSKLFITATILVLISALIAIDHEFLYQRSVREKTSSGHDQLWKWEALSLDGATGPESFAFDPFGQGPYAGVADGRIIKWEEHERRWIHFAITSQTRLDESAILLSLHIPLLSADATLPMIIQILLLLLIMYLDSS
ncbi:unnamed protein product [Dovyalis caffra]|uniref:Uncharacterized protein n=1 Tax=Dovyalis caffra TaxID=77055 RepID=A0AAV1RU46_9ROSI|nr:unnamed protein product [Dovyalis caffra]